MKTINILLVVVSISATMNCDQSQGKSELAAMINGKGVSLLKATLQGNELIKTCFGDIQLTESYLTKESIDKLNDQLDLQRAIEVYQWSLPLTTFQMWYNAHKE